MKKLLKIGFPLVAIAMLLSASFASADYNVTVGTTNTYDIVESTQTVTIGSNNGGGDGFLFEDHAFAVGTQVVVEVTAAAPTDLDYDVTVGTITDSTGSSTLGDALGVAFTIILPLFITLAFGGIWNQTYVDSGPGLYSYYFVDPVMSDVFYELSNDTAISESFNDTESDIKFDNVGGVFDNTSTIAVFDWAFDFTWENASTTTDWGGTYRWKLAYNKNTGVVQGWKVLLDYEGTLEGTIFNYYMAQTGEIVGYDIGNFAIGVGGFIPGFEWFIAISALASIAAVAVTVRKRK